MPAVLRVPVSNSIHKFTLAFQKRNDGVTIEDVYSPSELCSYSSDQPVLRAIEREAVASGEFPSRYKFYEAAFRVIQRKQDPDLMVEDDKVYAGWMF